MICTPECFRLRVKARLAELGMTQTELCALVGRNPSWLSNLYRRRTRLNTVTLPALCKALQVPRSFFISEAQDILSPRKS